MAVFRAPAKINLYLHVTGKRPDGYHLLDSLVVFAGDIADIITIEPAPAFSLSVCGPFAKHLDDVLQEDNIVFKAAHGFATLTGKSPHVAIRIEKNIPAGAGLGGGSADAAATVRGLIDLWQVTPEKTALQDFLLSLGADVPVCFYGSPSRFSGVGERIVPAPPLPRLSMILVCPDVHSSTRDIFATRTGPFSSAASLPVSFDTMESLIGFLQRTQNDLSAPAQGLSPAIHMAQTCVAAEDGCLFARMSGSGSAVFGLFHDDNRAALAAGRIGKTHPGWWCAVTKI